MIVDLAVDMVGYLVPGLALFAFTLPLISKIAGEKLFPAIWGLIAIIYAAVSSTIILIGVWVSGKPILYGFGGWPPPIGISYEVDGLSAVLGAFTAWILLFIAVYSVWYNRHFDEPEWYYILLIGLAIGMLGSIYTGDIFNLFVMIEVLGISAYGLVAYYKNRPEAVEASVKYAIIGATATTLYFLGLAIFYGVYGSLNMAQISLINTLSHGYIPGVSVAALLAIALSLWAFTYKAALFPNHFWLPDAHPEAPTPVSAALSGLVVNVGVYAAIRFLYTVFPSTSVIGPYRDILLFSIFILGFLGAFVGAVLMMVQEDLKRLLAYSTVSHIGLIFMAAGFGFTGVPEGAAVLAVTAAVYHILAHGFAKSLLFMSSGVFIDSAGSRNLGDMRGVGRKYPVVSAAFTMGFLSLMGLVPFGGFFSKLLMYEAYMSAGQIIPALMVIVVSALSVPGYAKAIYSVVFAQPAGEARSVRLRGVGYMLLIMALIVLLLGLLYPWVYSGLSVLAGGSISPAGIRSYQESFISYFNRLLGGVR